jgi:hypothetical protein
MISSRWTKNSRTSESGQALAFLVLALALVFLAAGAFSVDMSNLWFHRQTAQNAADSACTAGAMDMLLFAQGQQTGRQHFTPGVAFTCPATPTVNDPTPCQYAAKNGYNGIGQVSVSFPSSVTGVPTSAIPPSGIAPNAFMRVDVTDNVQTYFSGLLSGSRTQTVRAFAACGLVLAASPVPLMVLDPKSADAPTLDLQGNPNVSIVGGPQRSIQVNSSNPTSAVHIQGSASLDLSHGGPNGTGSDLAVYGGPATPPGGFSKGSTGHWDAPAAPLADPFAQLPAPAQPTNGPLPKDGVAVGKVNGCPEDAATGCQEYSPGYYPNGIDVKHATAIFDPGIYYVVGGMTAESLSCLRPSTAVGDGSGGTLFYFADGNSLSVGSNSGKSCPTGAGKDFATTTGTGSLPFGAKCTGASTLPANVPATLTGSVLLGPCNAPTVGALCAPNCATNYGDPLGTGNPIGEQRGILFFQNRSRGAAADFSGGGQFLLSGTMYLHQCVTGGADTGLGCNATSAFNSSLTLGGNSGAGTIVGQIVVDQLILGGNSGITMDLNGGGSYSIMKATLLR